MKLKNSPMVRARRAALAFGKGPAMLAYIEKNKPALVQAASDGLPPVGVLSKGLLKNFNDVVRTAPVRQFVGIAVKAILATEGFEVAQTGVRLRDDPLFTTGAIYRRASDSGDPEIDAVRDAFGRLVRSLTNAEKKLLLDVLKTALGESQ